MKEFDKKLKELDEIIRRGNGKTNNTVYMPRIFISYILKIVVTLSGSHKSISPSTTVAARRTLEI